MQSTRTKEDVSEYVEWQSQYKCKVVSAKPEHSFEDLGEPVHVWNVKTDKDGAWWVVEGQSVPMNLYPQEAYYFSADEVYSFHMGLMRRMESRRKEYIPEDYVEAVAQNSNIAPLLFRKLKSVATLVDTAIEIEDFQAIGVQCREILIELGNYVYEPHMAGEEEPPQASNFKKKAELCARFHCPGSANGDYRKIIKKLTEAVWDLSCKITHSTSSTAYDVSSCVSLCISLVSMYTNIIQKSEDFLSGQTCSSCSSKKLKIMSQFQKYWLTLVDDSFFRASKLFWRTNSDFFSKSYEKSNFGPLPSSPVNAGCSRYSVVYIRLIRSIQAC